MTTFGGWQAPRPGTITCRWCDRTAEYPRCDEPEFCSSCWPKVFEDHDGELVCEVQGCDARYPTTQRIAVHYLRAHGYEPDELP